METLYRRFWQKIFQITDTENETFDGDTENEVHAALQLSQHLLQPTETIDHHVNNTKRRCKDYTTNQR